MKPKKPSWIPIVAAFAIPAALLAIVPAMARKYGKPDTAQNEMRAGSRRGSANVSVKLKRADGSPIAGAPVTFTTRKPTESGAWIDDSRTVNTDDAGIATLSVPKLGALVISADGAMATIPDLDYSMNDLFEVNLVAAGK